MIKDAAQCRRHAAFCRRVASKSLPPLAAEFNRMAEVWAKQAEELERRAEAGQSMDGDQNGRRRGEWTTSEATMMELRQKFDPLELKMVERVDEAASAPRPRRPCAARHAADTVLA
jgi:hypothetical protein